MSELANANASVTVAHKLLRWIGVTLAGVFATGAVAWAARTDGRLMTLETLLAEMSGDRTRLIESYRDFQAQTRSQLDRLLDAVTKQGERLSRIEARLEQK